MLTFKDDDLAFILYSHSSLEWILEPFIDRLEQYFPILCQKYLFIDKDIKFEHFITIQYNDSKFYSERLLDCLNKLEEEFVLIHHEDMIFYDYVDMKSFHYYFNLLKNNNQFSSIKLMCGGMSQYYPNKFATNVYYLQDDEQYRFVIQPSIWRRKDLIKILEFSANMSIDDSSDSLLNYMKEQDFKMLFCWNPESDQKRGIYHWDNSKYPFIATALNKGNWNISEYPIEIENLKLEYNLK